MSDPEQASKGMGTCTLSPMLPAELKADLPRAPSTQTQHYFVNVNDSDPDIDNEAAGMDPAILELQSMSRFLTMPTVTIRINSNC
jgi:hypothetical protein